MIAPRLVALGAGLVLLVTVAEGWRRHRTDDPEHRPEEFLSVLGSALLVLVLVGFDGAFGLITDPGLSSDTATTVQTVLIVLSLAAYAGSGWYRLRG